jgi:Flp pilus assembly protein TadG
MDQPAQRGAVTLELLGTFPIWLLLCLLFFQTGAAGLTLVRAEAAAHAAARALARGNDPLLAAQQVAGALFAHLDAARIDGCLARVQVTLHVPWLLARLLPGATFPLQRAAVWPAEVGDC